MNYLVFVIPPLLGAAIGYITNVIAVELLFHPRKPINILGFKIQGLIPARSRELTERFLDTLSDILTKEDFEFVIGDAVSRTLSENEVAAKIGELFSRPPLSNIKEWAEKSGILGRFLAPLSEAISSILQDTVKDAIVKNIANNIDLREFVIRKAEEISEEEIEKLFKKFASKELRFIEISGAVLGFLIGVIQSIVMYFLIH